MDSNEMLEYQKREQMIIKDELYETPQKMIDLTKEELEAKRGKLKGSKMSSQLEAHLSHEKLLYGKQKAEETYSEKEMYAMHSGLRSEMVNLDEDTSRSKDSGLMRDVKGALIDLTLLYHRSLENLMSKSGFDSYEQELNQRYDNLIQRCQVYENARSPISRSGKHRKKMVISIREKCEAEKQYMINALHQIFEETMTMPPENAKRKLVNLCLDDCLRLARTTVVNGVEEFENNGNNSDVIMIKVANNETKFFKSVEILAKTPEQSINNIYDKNFSMKKKKDANEIAAGIYVDKLNSLYADEPYEKAFKSHLIRFVYDIYDAYAAHQKELHKAQKNNVEPDVLSIKEKAFEDSIASKVDIAKSVLQMQLQVEGADAGYVEKAMEYFSNSLTADRNKLLFLAKTFGPALNSYSIAANNGIEGGTNLTYRNVASCRMRDLCGMKKNILVESRFGMIKKDGKTKYGLIMDKAKGESVTVFKDKYMGDKYQVMFTPEAAKQLIQLQLLDQICGQLDRHGENMFFDYKVIGNKVYVTGVTGIDNDQAFGQVSQDELLNGKNRMVSLKWLKRVDRETYEMIQNLSMEKIRHELADCGIKEAEFKAMEQRILAIQQQLKKEKDNYPNEDDFFLSENNFTNISQSYDTKVSSSNTGGTILSDLNSHNMLNIEKIPNDNPGNDQS